MLTIKITNNGYRLQIGDNAGGIADYHNFSDSQLDELLDEARQLLTGETSPGMCFNVIVRCPPYLMDKLHECITVPFVADTEKELHAQLAEAVEFMAHVQDCEGGSWRRLTDNLYLLEIL